MNTAEWLPPFCPFVPAWNQSRTPCSPGTLLASEVCGDPRALSLSLSDAKVLATEWLDPSSLRDLGWETLSHQRGALTGRMRDALMEPGVIGTQGSGEPRAWADFCLSAAFHSLPHLPLPLSPALHPLTFGLLSLPL